VKGAGQLPEKKHFCHQNDKFGCIFPQFLTHRKHGSLGTRILQFNREITKLTKTVQKLSKSSRSDQGGGCTIAPLNTPLKSSLHSGAGDCHA